MPNNYYKIPKIIQNREYRLCKCCKKYEVRHCENYCSVECKIEGIKLIKIINSNIDFSNNN